MTQGYAADKEALLKRLSRIEGQVRGISRMVDEDKYCIDVITQIGAVTKALDQVSVKLLEEHVDHCVRDAVAAGGKRKADRKVTEMLETVQRFVRTR